MERQKLKNNFKRSVTTGFFIFLFTSVIILFGLNGDAVSGCTGDCMSCHEVLKDSDEHRSLKTCITCHDPNKPKLTFMKTLDGCGDRCFMCHNDWPKDGSHSSLNTCLNCHEK